MVHLILAILLAAVQLSYFWFVLKDRPIKVKHTDTIQSVRKAKTSFLKALLVLGIGTLIFFYFSILNNIIIGVYTGDVFIFWLVGAPVIMERLEKKEEILKKETK